MRWRSGRRKGHTMECQDRKEEEKKSARQGIPSQTLLSFMLGMQCPVYSKCQHPCCLQNNLTRLLPADILSVNTDPYTRNRPYVREQGWGQRAANASETQSSVLGTESSLSDAGAVSLCRNRPVAQLCHRSQRVSSVRLPGEPTGAAASRGRWV